VDDFAITVTSKSLRQNTKHFQTASSKIHIVGLAIKLGFSIPKIEFMHWTTVHNHILSTPNSHILTSGQCNGNGHINFCDQT
jgi:hypothetical protein